MSDLKPCPFCGGVPEIREGDVICTSCDCYGPATSMMHSENGWNLRAHLETMDEERALLEAMAHYWPMLRELVEDGNYLRSPWHEAMESIDEKFKALVAKREEGG